MTKTKIQKIIKDKVCQTPFIDTHEHLCEEKTRLENISDCWFDMLRPYLGDDLISAGLSQKDFEKAWQPDTPLPERWNLIAPYWDFVKNTSYTKAILITLKRLYDIDEITKNNLELIQEKFLALKKKGFYKTVLRNVANVKWCQVNSLEGKLFCETEYPDLLKQDISFVPMFADETSVLGESVEQFSQPTGIEVKNINDWYAVIDWYFNKYAKAAIAVKSQNAYNREMNYERVKKKKPRRFFSKE